MCSGNIGDRESAGLLFTSKNAGFCVVDSANANVSASSSEVVFTHSASGIPLDSEANAASCGNASSSHLTQDTHCGKEFGIMQGRVSREPIDRARYVVVNGSNGTTFVCTCCNKQYIHRKSLNKHWNDKHANDIGDRGAPITCSVSGPVKNLFSVTPVHMAPNRSSSVVRSTVHSYALCSPTYSVLPAANSWQKTYDDLPGNKSKHKSTIRQSVLWHSLAVIHSNQERDLNSFCYVPMPAHAGGHNSGTSSFLKQLFCDDDCQVLDLSKGSSFYDLSYVPALEVPVDLSLKSKIDGSEKATVQVDGIVETISKSPAASFCKEISTADRQLSKRSKASDNCVAKCGDSVKDMKCMHTDLVAVLRHMHSDMLNTAANQSVSGDSSSRCNASELKLNLADKPSVEDENPPNGISKMTAKTLDGLASSEETHEFFGGISRGGHIRCKKCDFSATCMLLFSRHVARHVRKPDTLAGICDESQYGDGSDELECRFLFSLGLQRTDVGNVDKYKQSSGSYHNMELDSVATDENSESTCEVIANLMPSVEANGFGSNCDGESGPHKNCKFSDIVQRKPAGGYRRGVGLTTTESSNASGRSWRRRRLRKCERCGYVTDNVTTLKRHEEKHGAVGMYRCQLCDYTVNQQHILDYHMQNVHQLPKQTSPARKTSFSINNHSDEHSSTLIDDGHHASVTKDLSRDVYTSDSAFRRASGKSQVAEVHDVKCAVNKCSVIMGKNRLASVTLARRRLLDAFGLQLGRGVCVRCGFCSLNTLRMKQHRLRHPHERHACSLCPHTSPTAQLLSKHKRQHTGKSYQCPDCPFLAASPNRLLCHTQFHGVKLRHACDKCSYSVDRANLMAQHRRLHASTSTAVPKRRWLHCTSCQFKTINKCSLVTHERGHYASNCRYMCSLCSFGTDVANIALSHQHLHSRII